MLFNGERIGNGEGFEVDVAVDPLEGTTLCAKGQPNALAVIAVAEKGAMFDPGPLFYMEKLATDNEVGACDRYRAPQSRTTCARVARAKGKPIHEITVVVLDRPRHDGRATPHP